jgi:nitrate/nitrite-specific signal transduction histidine kinase
MSIVLESNIKRYLRDAVRRVVPRPLGWSGEDRGRAQRHFIAIIGGLGVTMLALVVSGLVMVLKPAIAPWLWALQIVFLLILVFLLGSAIACVQHCLLHPLSHLRRWAAELRRGNLSARVPHAYGREFIELADDVNQLSAQLQTLSRDMESQVQKQSERLAQKTRSLDLEKNRLARMEERVTLANELHDSLAQTLASLRFQVRVLDETLHQGDECAIWEEMERVENSLDEAHLELRELIAHFRAPIDKRGLLPAIETTVSRFRQETDIAIFLQNHWRDYELAADAELHILRIIQEALTNIRKHSEADTVRILLRQDADGARLVLIEDDGVGFDQPAGCDHPGQHIGLSIMYERARSIDAELNIDSEVGEGTRILLKIPAVHEPAEA